MMNCLMSPTVWVWLNLPTSLRREEVSTKYNRVDVPANTHTHLLPSARRICTEVIGCPGSITTEVERGGGCGAGALTSGVRLSKHMVQCRAVHTSDKEHSLAEFVSSTRKSHNFHLRRHKQFCSPVLNIDIHFPSLSCMYQFLRYLPTHTHTHTYTHTAHTHTHTHTHQTTHATCTTYHPPSADRLKELLVLSRLPITK